MTRGSPPLIGITADLSEASPNGARRYQEATVFLPRRYVSALERAGAVPVALAAQDSAPARRALIGRLDGLLISGGNFDIHPRIYGERPIKQLGIVKPARSDFELEIAALALRRDLPILGICGGAQAINVALGGTLYQDIAAQIAGAAQHEQNGENGHPVRLQSGTRLRRIVGRDTLRVNTTHHQAIKRLGRGLRVDALAEDGVIEGVESTGHEFVLGLQWHPEVLAPRQMVHRRIFSAFVAACRKRRSR